MRLCDPLGNSVRGIGQLGSKREEIALNLFDVSHQIGVDQMRTGGPEACVQLVDFAVRVNPIVSLRDAGIVKQRGLTKVPGLCVDLHA